MNFIFSDVGTYKTSCWRIDEGEYKNERIIWYRIDYAFDPRKLFRDKKEARLAN